MKFPKKTIFNSRHALHMFALTLLVAIMSVAVSAQKTFSGSKTDSEKLLLNESANLDQCQNGAAADGPPQACVWINGNLNVNNSQWEEAQSVPYRIRFGGLVPTQSYTIVLGYDTTEGGIHTLDYLTTVSRTQGEALVDPCIGVAGCTTFTSFPIPLDPRVLFGLNGTDDGGAGDDITPGPDGTNGTGDDNSLTTGNFRMYGGTITAASAYSYNGDFTGNSQAFITLTFTADVANPVLAWSGHIATRFDWGFGNAAVQLTGSPYHMRISGGTSANGNQDRSMKIDAVVFPAQIIIRKEFTALTFNTSTQPFSFNSNTASIPSFQLTDNRDAQPLPSPMCNPDGTTPLGVIDYTCIEVDNEALFDTSITITEATSPAPFSLLDLQCSISNGGNNVIGTVSPTVATTTPTATIVLKEANIATCLFRNTALTTTAAPASISGRVATADGTGISNARMTLINASTGETFIALTNPFGYYTFADMPVADFYILSVGHKRYSFSDEQRAFTLENDLVGVDFIAN